MVSSVRSLHRPRLSWLGAFALSLALLCVQGLGLWHRVVHAGGTARPALTVPARDATPTLRDAWLHPAGQADCQLLDDLLLADLQPQADRLPVPPALPQACPPDRVAADAPRAAPAAYHARAPPRRA